MSVLGGAAGGAAGSSRVSKGQEEAVPAGVPPDAGQPAAEVEPPGGLPALPAAARRAAPARHEPPGPRLRSMTVYDLAAVMTIEAQAYSHPWSQGNFVDSLAAGHLTGVLVDQNLIGYYVAMVGVDELHLLNLTVSPSAQGCGHGSALLAAVLAQAADRRLPLVWLEVRASNHRARALYARRGFEEAGLRRGYYPAARGREDAVVMRRGIELPAPSRADSPAPATASGDGHALD